MGHYGATRLPVDGHAYVTISRNNKCKTGSNSGCGQAQSDHNLLKPPRDTQVADQPMGSLLGRAMHSLLHSTSKPRPVGTRRAYQLAPGLLLGTTRPLTALVATSIFSLPAMDGTPMCP